MDAKHVDALNRSLLVLPTRRDVMRGLTSVVLGLGMARGSFTADARKKHKNKSKRNGTVPQPNAYGCLSAGQPCLGQDELCCSGLCAGKKPKKGKPDKRTCAARNTGGCTAAQDSCALNLNVPCLSNGVCTRTTGEADFCARLGVGKCMTCAKDADCYLLGPGAACIVCDLICPGATACFAAAA